MMKNFMLKFVLTISMLLLISFSPVRPLGHASDYLELPILAAVRYNDLGVFELMLMGWDRKANPNPAQLQWVLGGVRYGKSHLGAMSQAFDYALERNSFYLAHRNGNRYRCHLPADRERRSERRCRYGRWIHRDVQGRSYPTRYCRNRYN